MPPHIIFDTIPPPALFKLLENHRIKRTIHQKHTRTRNTPHPQTPNRFSSGDLSSEVDDVDPNSLPPAARPIQDQPTKPPVGGGGGPPSMPPPPAPGQPAGAAPELSLSFGAGKAPATAAPAPPRGVSAPTSPAKSRESLLQRVQSLTGAARDQGASILGTLGLVWLQRLLHSEKFTSPFSQT